MRPMPVFRTLCATLLVMLAGAAFGQAPAQCVTLRNGDTACPAAESRCVQNRYGDWMCSPSGGDAAININGDAVCGAGACVKDINGVVMCSVYARGAAALDRYSKAACTSGCAPATTQACKLLTK